MAGAVSRARDAIRRHGGGGVVRIGWRRLSDSLYLHEKHVWYELRLAAVPEIAMPGGCILGKAASREDLQVAAQTGKDSQAAERLLGQGHELWLAREGNNAIFTCWIFRGTAPAAAKGAWLDLPAETVCIEDSVTAPAYRGQSAGPAAVATLCHTLEKEGIATMITKVAVDNAPSHRAVEKLGMRPVGTSETRKIGPLTRTILHEPSGYIGNKLAIALS